MTKSLIKITQDGNVSYTTCPAQNAEKLKALFEECACTVEIYNYPVALEVLPEEAQEQVKNKLKAFEECSVTFERGQFTVSVNICLLSSYPADHMVLNRYKQTEIYTLEERKQNFFEEFGYHSCFIR